MSQNQQMTVVEVTPLTEHIIRLKLKPSQPFNYTAGQYVLLGFEEADLKPFSIANAPSEDGLLAFHIRKQADNDWMTALFEVKAYDTLWVSEPKDQYAADLTTDLPIILVAGGTGFAPMKALLEVYLAEQKEQIIEFYWGARHLEDLYEHEQMLALCTQHHNLNYIPVLSDEARFVGKTGLVHQAVLGDHPDLSKFRVFVCGPWPMQEAAKQDFMAAGLPENQFN